MENEITYSYQPPQVNEDVPLILHDQQQQMQYSVPQNQQMPVYTDNPQQQSVPQYNQYDSYQQNQMNQQTQSYNPQNMYQPPQPNNMNNNYGYNPQNQPQQTNQQYPHAQQPIKVPDVPCQMYCAHCDELVISKVEYNVGCAVYLLCCLLCVFGLICCALIPCCLNAAKDVNHKWFVFIIFSFF